MEISRIDDAIDMFCKSKELGILRDYLFSALVLDSKSFIINNGDYRVENKVDLGHGMFAIEQKYKLDNSGIFESHRKYVDFQLIISGVECMEVGNIDSFNIKCDYDEVKDITLFDAKRDVSKIILYPRDLLVLFSNDIHRGGLVVNKNLDVIFKSVVKVPKSILKFRF